MGIETSKLQEIEDFLGRGFVSAADFRQHFPGLSFTSCSSSDLSEERPHRSYPEFDLYLIDGSDHCVHFTTAPANATGVVVARHPRKRTAS